MKLKNVLIVVDDMEESIRFYKEIFGLQVIVKQEGNVILSEGLVLQDAKLWADVIEGDIIPFNNTTELYFEDNDVEGLADKLASNNIFVRVQTELTELAGGQKMMRFYDPSGNLIEVRTQAKHS
ncbi:MAG: VOC family protein [Agathobacter sp.]|nr:VOC family protein [uncultured Agathobacter sp.]MCI7112361.1 VOC family protein [Lachnobacterium sp.]MDY6155631.1 VOC family protein [Agathobacter sp.]